MNTGRVTIIDNESVGFSVLPADPDPPDEEDPPAWTVAADVHLQYGGSYRYAPSGTGDLTATWTFDVLRIGLHELWINWSGHVNRATDATYLVYNGSILIDTIVIDQSEYPVGGEFGSVPFQRLGVYHLDQPTAKIVLSDDADGFVIADAAVLIEVAPSPDAPSGVHSLSANPGSAQDARWASRGQKN